MEDGKGRGIPRWKDKLKEDYTGRTIWRLAKDRTKWMNFWVNDGRLQKLITADMKAG